jgi:hypothetical protein
MVLENGTRKFSEFVEAHNIQTLPGTRSIIVEDIHQVGSSCGFSVPFYDFKDFRPTLNDFFANKEKKFKDGKAEESMDRSVGRRADSRRPKCANKTIVIGLIKILGALMGSLE